MKVKTILIWLLFNTALVMALPQEGQHSDTEKIAISSVQDLAKKIEACKSTEEIAEFHKKWVKVAWGPVENVKFDVERTNSLIKPFRGTIEFVVPYSSGERLKTKQDAVQDRSFKRIFLSPVRYKLTLDKQGNRYVEEMSIKNALSGLWSNYQPARPERFCWITILVKD